MQLEKSIKERPEKQDLVDRNILKGKCLAHGRFINYIITCIVDSKVAPSLQAAQEKLQRAQLEDKLGKALESRPKPEELVGNGILTGEQPTVIDGTCTRLMGLRGRSTSKPLTNGYHNEELGPNVLYSIRWFNNEVIFKFYNRCIV